MHREEGYVKTQAEIGVMLPHANECLGLPEAGRGKKGFFPRAFRENLALLHLAF